MTTTLRILFILLFGLSLFACAQVDGTPAGDETSYAQGLTILDLQPDHSLSVAFTKGDDVILLDLVRGQATPSEYHADATVPKFELDTRITDGIGRLLYVRRGGDDFTDPTWTDDLLWQDNLLPDPRGNRRLFEMIPEAVLHLEAELLMQGGTDALESLRPELDALRSFGANITGTLDDAEEAIVDKLDQLGPEAFEALAGGGGTDGPEDDPKNLATGWYFLEVHDKAISFTFGTGRHSATRIAKYSGPGTYTYFDFCNHGTCAGDMDTKCDLDMIHKPDWTALTCNTEYNTYSNDGGHNCHDDTRTQMAAFVYGPEQERNQFWCNDGDSSVDLSGGFEQGGSPDCNDGTDTGYNHPSMMNYSGSNTASATISTTQFRVILSANTSYTISTCGSTSTDTYLRLRYGQTQVAYNDDGCGLQSSMTFTPPATGTYYVHAGCFGTSSCSGKVHVKMNSTTTSPNYYTATNTSSATQNVTTFSVALTAGTTYKISTCGSTTTDTYLRLYGASGQITANDDGCGLQSSITYTPTVSTTYTVWAGCFSSGTCSGVVSVVKAPQACTPAGDRLCPGETLFAGESITSANGAYRLVYQADGNLVVYRLSDWSPLWAAGSNSSPAQVTMQDDGNLVVYRSPWAAQWSSSTWVGDGSGHYLVMENDSSLNMYSPEGKRVWSSR